MRNIRAKSIAIASALATIAFAVLFAPQPLVNGQTGSTRPGPSNPRGPVRPSPGGLKTPQQQKAPNIRERQLKMLEMEREAAKPRTPEEENLALAQIAEDYERIQVINNKMMGATMSRSIPDYGVIAETTAEIKKRANRILDNLRLPKAEGENATKSPEHKKVTDAARMKVALLSLDGSIMSFVQNPIFKNTGVVDVEQAAKLRRDLETIIEFSQLISKDAEELKKPSSNPR